MRRDEGEINGQLLTPIKAQPSLAQVLSARVRESIHNNRVPQAKRALLLENLFAASLGF